MSNIDIAETPREFTVDEIMSTVEPTTDQTSTSQNHESPIGFIKSIKDKTLKNAETLDQLLADAIAQRDALQAEINELREAKALWGPIQDRLLNGPHRRRPTEETTPRS